MKNENEFNAFLKGDFRRCKGYKAIKVSDRFKIGLPDWLIFHDGRAVAAECKFAKTWKKGNMLAHPVTPPQITSLEGFSAVFVSTAIIIGVADPRVIYVGRYKDLTPSGNVTGEILDRDFRKFQFGDVRWILEHMFGIHTAETWG